MIQCENSAGKGSASVTVHGAGLEQMALTFLAAPWQLFCSKMLTSVVIKRQRTSSRHLHFRSRPGVRNDRKEVPAAAAATMNWSMNSMGVRSSMSDTLSLSPHSYLA